MTRRADQPVLLMMDEIFPSGKLLNHRRSAVTNNPDKVYQLADFGMEIIERVPIQMDATAHDLFYLKTKQQKMGHILNYK